MKSLQVKDYQQRVQQRFIAVVADAYNASMTLEEIDAAYAKARADLVEFMRANND